MATVNQKKQIILDLWNKRQVYKTFDTHTKALKFYCDSNEIKKKDVNEGYFKYFFKQGILENNFENKAHRVYSDLQRYLAPAKPAKTQLPDGTPLRRMPTEFKKVQINEFDPGNQLEDPRMFQTWITNTEIDEIMSDDGGTMASSAIMITGGPGVGKSTLLFWKAARLRSLYPDLKIAIVSSEMEEDDLMYEKRRKPWMNTIKFILTSDYGPELMDAMWTIYTMEYDIVILDSFADTCEKMRDFCGVTMSQAENILVSLIKKGKGGVGTKDGETIFRPKTKEEQEKLADVQWTYTTTLAIQQVTKGGTFAGSNKLKHAITAMLELRRESSGDRYMVFTKHRRCGQYVGKKLYYFLAANMEVSFDAERWEREKAGDTEEGEDTANLTQEGMSNQLIAQFGELTSASMQRARALLMQDDLPADLLATAGNGTPETQVLNMLPEGYDINAIYEDSELNMWVLEIEGTTPIVRATKADVIRAVWEKYNQENPTAQIPNELMEDEGEEEMEPAE